MATNASPLTEELILLVNKLLLPVEARGLANTNSEHTLERKEWT
jgi:hypothetical protein